MSGAHCIAPPSSRARHVQCPASIKLEAQFPETEPRPEAAEGEAAHWAAAEMLAGRQVAVGQAAPNGVFLTDEMIDGAQVLVDDVWGVLRQRNLGLDALAVEVPVDIKRVHPQVWGTPDVRLWAPTDSQQSVPLTLYVWDFKFGHRPVEVFENLQLSDYAAGCLEQAGHPDTSIIVRFRIVQPRCFHKGGPVREWMTPASGLRGLINISSNAVHEGLGAEPRARVGAECRDCRARHACPTLQRSALAACDEAGRAQALELPPAAAALEYRWLKRNVALMEARVAGLEEQLLSLARRGASLPGLMVEHGSGRQRWKKPATEVIGLGQMLGFDLAKPPEAITPKQALDKGLPAELLAEFAETPSGAAQLVEDDGSLTRRVFAKGTV